MPSEDSKVDAPFSVKGTCKRELPPGWHLWLILVPNGPKKNRLWPHACVTLAPPVKKKEKLWSWNTTITTRIAKPGDGRTFGIYLAGPYGHVLLENHLKVCEDFSQGTRTLPLPDKTEDIILCGGYRSVTLDRVPGLPDSGDRAQPLVI
jgi:hypothetical protein